MTEANGEFPTVIGADAKFKGELSFDKGVRIEGAFDGHIKSKGTLHVAEGAKLTSTGIEAANVKIEGECKGNFYVTEKLHLLATAKVEGELRTTRLEIADGAIFVGQVTVGQGASEAAPRRPTPQEVHQREPAHSVPVEVVRPAPVHTPAAPVARPRPVTEVRVPG